MFDFKNGYFSGIIRNRFALHGIKTADKWPGYHPHMTIVDLPQNETKLGEIITNIYGMLRFTPVQDIDCKLIFQPILQSLLL